MVDCQLHAGISFSLVAKDFFAAGIGNPSNELARLLSVNRLNGERANKSGQQISTIQNN